MTDQRLIDVRRFEDQVGSLASFRKVAAIFLELLPRWRDRAQTAVDQQDWTALAEQVHQMKGCCGMMCAQLLTDQSALVERHLKEADAHQASEALKQLFRLMEAVQHELRTVWLKDDA